MKTNRSHNGAVTPSTISMNRLLTLLRQQQLDHSAFNKLIDWAVAPPQRDEWHRALRMGCLVLGLALITSGVIYFGAFNWEALSRFQKFGLMEALVVAAFLGVMSRGIDSTVGQACLTAGSVLVGALLVVYSQVYQSGADAYTLFLGWGALIVPWTLASRSSVQWVLQVGLANVTFLNWWDQVADGGFTAFSLLYLALNGGIAYLWHRQRRPWMWKAVGTLFLTNALVPITLAACAAPWEWDLSVVCLLVLGVTLYGLWRFQGQVLQTMTLVAASTLTVAGSFTIWVFHEIDFFGILLMAGAILAEMSVAVKWLKAVHEAQGKSHTTASAPEPSPHRSVESPAEQLAGLAGVDVSVATLALGRDQELPWYVKVLTGMGAWVASWFLIGFFLIWMWDSEVAVGTYGTVLFLGSIVLRRSKAGQGLFLQYTCLAANLAGQFLILVAIIQSGRDGLTAGALTMLALQLIALASFPDQIARHLFAMSVVVSGGFACEDTLPGAGWWVWMMLVAIVLTALWSQPQKWLQSEARELYTPTALGLTSGFFGTLQVLAFNPLGENLYGPAVAVGFTLLAVAVGAAFRAPLVAVLGLAALGLLTHSVPELMAAVLLSVLSFRARNNHALLLSLTFFVSFGILFYYSLALTLWLKALTLVGSGAVFLLVRLFLGKESNQKVAHAF